MLTNRNQNNYSKKKKNTLRTNKDIKSLIKNLYEKDNGKYKHIVNHLKNYINKKNKDFIFKTNYNNKSIFYSYLKEKIRTIQKNDKVIIVDWENFRNYVKNNLFKDCTNENFFHPETDTIGFISPNTTVEKKPLSLPNIISILVIDKLINYYKLDKIIIVYKSSLYNEPINFYFENILQNKLNRNKFIFFKIYIHNIQNSYDNKIINKNEYDLIRGIDDYGCILIYDYLTQNNYINTSILTNDKRSFFDMLSFNKLLNINKRNYIFNRKFKNGLISDIQLSYIVGDINIKTQRVNSYLLNDNCFKSSNILNVIIRSIINFKRIEISNYINSNIIEDIFFKLKKINNNINGSKYEYMNNIFELFNNWFIKNYKK
jgi:hypothetical protein